MSKFFIDVEFTCFQGELLSLALVPEDRNKPVFYVQFDPVGEVDPWVVKHVIPFIGDAPKVSRQQAARMLVEYFAGVHPVIVADWPEDLTHLTRLLITGPGRMVPIRHMSFEYHDYPDFSTAKSSAIPHNALEDAKALRDYVVSKEDWSE